MEIKRETEFRAVLCLREVEESKDMIEAINRSSMTQLECRNKGGRPDNCAGLCAIVLKVAAMKSGRKMSKDLKRCPV